MLVGNFYTSLFLNSLLMNSGVNYSTVLPEICARLPGSHEMGHSVYPINNDILFFFLLEYQK